MATANVFVVDSSFKRTQVKVTPGKYLREVLEEACKSRKLNPEEYTLKTQNNKTLDLSQPFRLSGLVSGAKLQLTQASRSPSVVNVALQLPESEGGGRLSDKFASTTTLWQLLRKYEEGVAGGSGQKRNFTQRGVPATQSGEGSGSGRLVYEQPCVNIMGRSLETLEDLQKTLGQLGVTGSVSMRLSFKSTAQPLEEAMREISVYFSAVDTVPAGIGSAASPGPQEPGAADTSVPNADTENAAMPAEGAAGPEPNENASPPPGPTAPVVKDDVLASSSTTETQPSSQPEAPTPSTNGISVYRPPSSSTPAAALAPDDPSVFEPTIDHAKAHQAALERQSKNTRLLSDKELEAQESARQEKLAAVHKVVVRVRYPDQYNTELVIDAAETAAGLYGKVMGTLANAPEPFELRYLGSKGQATLPNSSSQRLVRDLGFRGRMLLTMAWLPEASMKARSEPSLKTELRGQAQELKVDLQSQRDEGTSAHKEAMAKPEAKSQGAGKKGGGDLEAKMRKFMGFGKK